IRHRAILGIDAPQGLRQFWRKQAHRLRPISTQDRVEKVLSNPPCPVEFRRALGALITGPDGRGDRQKTNDRNEPPEHHLYLLANALPRTTRSAALPPEGPPVTKSRNGGQVSSSDSFGLIIPDVPFCRRHSTRQQVAS